MKKILPLALVSFVVFLGAAWSIGWFVQAWRVKGQVEEAIAKLDPVIGIFSVEHVVTSGFPNQMVVTLKNPKGTLNLKPFMTQLYKRSSAAAGNSAGVVATPDYPDATYDYALKGDISFSLNALSDHLQLTYQGTDYLKLASAKGSVAMNNEYDGAFQCEVKLARDIASAFNRIWSLDRFFTQDAFAQQFREANCNIPSSISMDADTSQLIFSLAPSHVSIKSTPVPNRVNMAIDFAINDSEVMPAGDAAYAKMIALLVPENTHVVAPTPSIHGKQSYSVDMVMDLPKDQKNLATDSFTIQIKNLSAKSAASSVTMDFLASSKPQGENKQGELSFNMVMDTTPKQTDVAKAILPQFIQEMAKAPEFAAMIKNYDRAKVEVALFDALPNITQLGTITEKFSLTFNANEAKKTGDFDLKALELSTRDYGIMGSGKGVAAEGQMIPSINADLTCKNCIAMIDTLAAYLQRVDNALATLEPKNAGKLIVPPQQLAGVKGIVAELGTPSATAAQDLQFSVKSEAGGVNINGKPMQELMQLVQKYFPVSPAPAQ